MADRDDHWDWLGYFAPKPRTPWSQWPREWVATYRWYEWGEALCMAVVDERTAPMADRVAAAARASEIRGWLKGWRP